MDGMYSTEGWCRFASTNILVRVFSTDCKGQRGPYRSVGTYAVRIAKQVADIERLDVIAFEVVQKGRAEQSLTHVALAVYE
jgi:hypothetical protein